MHWFDKQAAKTEQLTPEQKHKVALIKQALGQSNKEIHHLVSAISTGEDSAAHFGPQASFGGRLFSAVEVRFRAQIGAEFLRARSRLAALRTGLMAERQFRDALAEAAAGADAWYRALSTDNGRTIFDAQRAMTKHFAKANQLQKAALANLEKGR